MRVLLPWIELQDAVAARLDVVLAGTALAGKVYNYVPQDTEYPYMFFGDIDTEDISDKGTANLITSMKFEIYSGQAGSRECMTLAKAVFGGLTVTPLVLGGTDHRIVGVGQLRDRVNLSQNTDGVGVVWFCEFRVAFLTQQTS